ncbi:MAG: hypothetical protein ACJ8BW_26075 [Ktedonobacteraceae bacterium]
MQRDLHTTAAAVQWVFEAYTLMLSTLILVGGRSAMRWVVGACSPLGQYYLP